MSTITKLDRHTGIAATTLAGVVESEGTYEIFDDTLIIRTTSSDTIHITPEIGKQLIKIIEDELLTQG